MHSFRAQRWVLVSHPGEKKTSFRARARHELLSCIALMHSDTPEAPDHIFFKGWRTGLLQTVQCESIFTSGSSSECSKSFTLSCLARSYLEDNICTSSGNVLMCFSLCQCPCSGYVHRSPEQEGCKYMSSLLCSGSRVQSWQATSNGARIGPEKELMPVQRW